MCLWVYIWVCIYSVSVWEVLHSQCPACTHRQWVWAFFTCLCVRHSRCVLPDQMCLYMDSQCVHVYLHAPFMPLSIPECLATCSVTHLFWVYILYVYAWLMNWGVDSKYICHPSRCIVCASSGCARPMCMYFCKITVGQLCEWVREKKYRIGHKECVCANYPADQPANGHLKPLVLLSRAHRTMLKPFSLSSTSASPTIWHALGLQLLPWLKSYKLPLAPPLWNCSLSLNTSPLLPPAISVTSTNHFRFSWSVDTSMKTPWYGCWE